jgi:hypothetical protein
MFVQLKENGRRFAYDFGGVEKLLSLGVWAEDSFEAVAREFLDIKRVEWSVPHATR